MADEVYMYSWSLGSTASSLLCISEVRTFALFFTKAYYKVALRGETYGIHVSNAARTASYTMLTVTCSIQSVVVLSGLDFEATGGSVVCYCLSNCLLRGHRFAVNMIWALFRS